MEKAAADTCSKRPNSRARVVVVGAGFAGVAAAAALRDGGIHDVIVLEAQNRPGGRVMKVALDGGFVETGAQFIHGEEGNVLYDLAKKYNMLLDKKLYQEDKNSNSTAEDYNDNLFCTSKGERVDQETATRLLRVVNEMIHDYANSFFKSSDGLNGTCKMTFKELIKVTREKVMAAKDGTEEIRDAIFRWVLQWEYTDNGARLEELSLERYGQYTYLPGFGLTLTSGGLEEIFTAFLQDSVPKDSLFLEKPVKSILWDPTRLSIAQGNAASIDGPKMQNLSFKDSEEALKVTIGSGRQDCISSSNLTSNGSQRKRTEPSKRSDLVPRSSNNEETEPRETAYTNGSAGPNSNARTNGVASSICQQGSAAGVPKQRGFVEQNPLEAGSFQRVSSDETSTSANCNTISNPPSREGDGDTSEVNLHPPSENKPVKVICEGGEVFQADHVIVTSSIGYLKKHLSTMFKPALPAEHQQAIRDMGFDTVAKVLLIWDNLDDVLSPEFDGVQLLWLKDHPPKVPSSKTHLKTKDGLNWYDNIQGFERIWSHKGALLTWLAGEEANIMESLPEQEVKDVLYDLLVSFTNNSDLPRPREIVRSNWHSNPYTLGGYSYIVEGFDDTSHATLAVPIPSAKKPLLCLAGEATSQRFYSTVHGAIESGQRAARAILKHYSLTS